ncbi:MAG: acyl-CoA dehydrogenase family protein [Tepidisphaeraceae bacterium]
MRSAQLDSASYAGKLQSWASERSSRGARSAAVDSPALLMKELAQRELLAPCGPQRHDRFARTCELARVLGRTCPLAVATTVLLHVSSSLVLISRYGDRAARERWLAPALRGELLMAGSAFTDDDIELHRSHNGLELSGIATVGLRSAEASWGIVLAQDPAHVSALMLVVVSVAGHGGAPGSHDTRPGTIRLTGRPIGTDHLLGEVQLADGSLDGLIRESRIACCEAVVTHLEAVVEETLAFVTRRSLGTDVLARKQVIRHRLVELIGRREIASALLAKASCSIAAGHSDAPLLAAMAQLVVCDTASEIVDECLQLFGGRGFLTDNWVTDSLRDVLALPLVLGDPMQLSEAIAAELVGGAP